MTEDMKNEISKKASEIAKLREKIYKEFSGSGDDFSIEALARILKPYYGYTADEGMVAELEQIKMGLERGAKEFDGMYETYVEEGEDLDTQALLKQKTDEMMKGLSEAQQRVIWYNVLDSLCFDDGKPKEDFMVKTAGMSLDELANKALEMLNDKCRAETDEEILRIVEDARQGVENVEFEEHDEFEEKDRDLIDAAAAYTVMRKSGPIDALHFGEQFAFQKKSLWSMIKTKSINVLKKIAAILSLVAVVFLTYCAIYALLRLGTPTFLMFFAVMGLFFPRMIIEAIEDVVRWTGKFKAVLREWLTDNSYVENLDDDLEEKTNSFGVKKEQMKEDTERRENQDIKLDDIDIHSDDNIVTV